MFKPVMDRLRRSALRGLSVPDLFARFRTANDEQAMAELVARTMSALRAACAPFLRDRDEIDEVIQEVFRLLAQRGDTIRDANCVEAWLQQTAINVARNRSRRQARLGSQPPDGLDVADPAPGPDLLLELREKHAFVLAEIERLNEDWRRALTLKLLEERSYAEVASILGASLDKVKQDVSRARKHLRARLLRKGIILPAAIASVLFGKDGWASVAGRHWMLSAIVISSFASVVLAVIYFGNRTEPPKATPPAPTKETAKIALPDPEQQVLDRLLPLLDQIVQAKAKRTKVIISDEEKVQWRFAWEPEPARGAAAKFRFDPYLTPRSFVDLTYDRWSGELSIDLASDGRNAERVDPARPIHILVFGAKVRMPVPDMDKLFDAFEPLLQTTPPVDEKMLEREVVRVTSFANGRDMVHRPAPRHGFFLKLAPGEQMKVAVRSSQETCKGQLFVWRADRAIALQSLGAQQGPWNYRNETTAPQMLFLAAADDTDGHWWTCHMRVFVEPDQRWRLVFDRDYGGTAKDFFANLSVSPILTER